MNVRVLLRKLSPRVEFWTVILLSFGFFVWRSTRAVFEHRERTLTNGWAIGLAVFEIVVLTIVAFLARARGWSLIDLGLHPSFGGTGLGIALYFAGTFVSALAYAIASISISAEVPRALMTAKALSWLAIVLVSIINPIFEETLVTGYIVNATARHGAAFAISASALIRFLYHTYQGPIAAVCILPLGLLFAAIYWRFRELWPLIVAHGLMDFLSLSYLARAV